MTQAHSARGGGYVPPRITDFGDLATLTADAGMLGIGGALPLAQASLPTPLVGGGGEIEVLEGGGSPPSDSSGPDGSPGDSAGDAGEPSGGAPPGGGGGGASGIGNGELPFTGFSAGVLAAIGAGLAGMGEAVRRVARRL